MRHEQVLLPLTKLFILWSGVFEQSFGVEYWSGVKSKFGVAKVLVLCSLNQSCILWSGVLEWSIGVEWSQILVWQKLSRVQL